MGLQSLDIRDFRNIQNASLTFSSGLNLITGTNAAGKTSLLEAIYCLGRVRSFRTGIVDEPVRYGQTSYRLVGQVRQEGGRIVPVGIERQATGIQVHLDGRSIRRLSDLAGSFPVQVMSGDTDSILEGGPRYRRQAIDWALFHVEHPYREYWQRYTRALRQRNAALRAKVSIQQVRAWDTEMLETGEQIDQLRRRYFEYLQPKLQEILADMLPGNTASLYYQSGWPAGLELAEALAQSLERDRTRGYTQHGIHRADFRILVNGRNARSHCSRGQQKALTVGFILAQIGLQQDRDVALGAFLLDDFASELDESHQERVLCGLQDMRAQVFVTAIQGIKTDHAAWHETKRFHVEHGEIQEVV
jgi:DNA replication and repair protein RecF